MDGAGAGATALQFRRGRHFKRSRAQIFFRNCQPSSSAAITGHHMQYAATQADSCFLGQHASSKHLAFQRIITVLTLRVSSITSNKMQE